MRKSVGCLLLFAFATACFAQQNSSSTHFDGNSWWAHVKFLADDSLEGRNTGSQGLRKAQAYAVEQLQKAGFQPAGTDGFYQPVRFTQFQVDEPKSSLALVANGKPQPSRSPMTPSSARAPRAARSTSLLLWFSLATA